MGSDRKLASAVVAKTVRSCDSCIRKRARWYCAADDAFLCQACDGSVHSANSLARRHERVRLKMSSSLQIENKLLYPTWHHGFKKKARTPRHHHGKHASNHAKPLWDPLQNLVPEMGSEEMTWQEENEEQLLYRVPVFDPFVAECCLSGTSNVNPTAVFSRETRVGRSNNSLVEHDDVVPSDVDLAQFAADMESLLGTSLDEEALDMVGLGISKEKEEGCFVEYGRVKIEEKDDDVEAGEAECNGGYMRIDDMAREPFELNFDHDSPSICCEQDDKVGGENIVMKYEEEKQKQKQKVLLRLDYEGVMAAWADQRCPWTTGDHPNKLDAENMGGCGRVEFCSGACGDEMGVVAVGEEILLDEGREARYREKRRRRLFTKKIRYEVRKLNAENRRRTRMKGRFVKITQ